MLDVTITSSVDSTITINGQSFPNTKSATVSVAWNTNVSYLVSATGYETFNGTINNVKSNTSQSVELQVAMVPVTINSNVSAVITINGQSKSNAKTATINVPYGSTVNWSVSASGYVTQSGSFQNVTSANQNDITLAKKDSLHYHYIQCRCYDYH